MVRLAVALLVAVTLLTNAAYAAYADQAERDLSGQYRCIGTSQGAQYTGNVVIRKVNKGYKIDWVVGDTKYSGIGFVEEDRFAVAWTVRTPKGVAIGVVSYKINKDGSLKGKWTDPALQGIYDETLIPIHGNLI